MATNDTTGTFLAGLVVGGLIGTAIAQLFAPQTNVFATKTHRTPWRELNVRTSHPSVQYGSRNAPLPSQALE